MVRVELAGRFVRGPDRNAGRIVSVVIKLRIPADFSARADAAARYQLINHLKDQLSAIAKLTALVEERLRDAGINVPYS